MLDSVYKVIELVGTSENSWEEAARNAILAANQSLRDVRIAEVTKLDMRISDTQTPFFRARMQVSFKYDR